MMQFEVALVNIKQGYRARRKEWPQSDWIALHPSSSSGVCSAPYIVRKCVDGHTTPWQPTHDDLLAGDWRLVGIQKWAHLPKNH